MGYKFTGLRINEAIKLFNSGLSPDQPKMTQQTLGAKVFGESLTETRAGWYLSMWASGKELTKLLPEHVLVICKETGTDPNYLYGYEAKH